MLDKVDEAHSCPLVLELPETRASGSFSRYEPLVAVLLDVPLSEKSRLAECFPPLRGV